jgi:hypothetical protein
MGRKCVWFVGIRGPYKGRVWSYAGPFDSMVEVAKYIYEAQQEAKHRGQGYFEIVDASRVPQ